MLSTVRTYASFVKFSHTVFALPFAIAGYLAALAIPLEHTEVKRSGDAPFVHAQFHFTYVEFSWTTLGLILCCMVGARSFAMALNRIVDREIDAQNPRTAAREIPAGRLSLSKAWAFAILFLAVYLVGCAGLGPVTLVLSPIPIALMVLYPYTKRFTSMCHLVLGASLGLAPVGAWVAARAGGSFFGIDAPLRQISATKWMTDGKLSYFFSQVVLIHESPAFLGWRSLIAPWPWLAFVAVTLWVAGFDIIYALQDDEFDRQKGLYSMPAKLGRKGALRNARWFHLVAGFILTGLTAVTAFQTLELLNGELGVGTEAVWKLSQLELMEGVKGIGTLVLIIALIRQHGLVKVDDLSKVNAAFFTTNGVISIVFGSIFVICYLLAIF